MPRYNWNIVENGVKHHDPLGYLQCTYLFGTHIFWHFVRHRSVQLFLVPSGHTMLQIGIHTLLQLTRPHGPPPPQIGGATFSLIGFP